MNESERKDILLFCTIIGGIIMLIGYGNTLPDIGYNNMIIAKTNTCIRLSLDGKDYCPCVLETINMMEEGQWHKSKTFKDAYNERKEMYTEVCLTNVPKKSPS